MPEQVECRKFSALVEVVLDVDVVDGSVKKFWANNIEMVQNLVVDALMLRGRSNFGRQYEDGMKLRLGIKDISCTSVSEKSSERSKEIK